jgi:hypothetical protein
MQLLAQLTVELLKADARMKLGDVKSNLPGDPTLNIQTFFGPR